MKKVVDLANAMGLTIVNDCESLGRVVDGKVYCCDLLSIVMGRASAGGVWITVMANINAVAVAVLCDLACIVVAEGMQVDELTKNKALQQNVVILTTEQPIFETAKAIDRYLHDET